MSLYITINVDVNDQNNFDLIKVAYVPYTVVDRYIPCSFENILHTCTLRIMLSPPSYLQDRTPTQS